MYRKVTSGLKCRESETVIDNQGFGICEDEIVTENDGLMGCFISLKKHS